MVVVLIEWSIAPNDEAVARFKDYWRDEARIKNKAGLVGEFLSEPIASDKLPFDADDLGKTDPQSGAFKFMNVAIWKDWPAFYEEVGQYMKGGRKDFEVADRRRVILNPKEWRLGDWELPPATCD